MTASADDDLLKEEYFHLNKTVEEFDQRALTIKAWSVTLSMAGVGAAFTQNVAVIGGSFFTPILDYRGNLEIISASFLRTDLRNRELLC